MAFTTSTGTSPTVHDTSTSSPAIDATRRSSIPRPISSSGAGEGSGQDGHQGHRREIEAFHDHLCADEDVSLPRFHAVEQERDGWKKWLDGIAAEAVDLSRSAPA